MPFIKDKLNTDFGPDFSQHYDALVEKIDTSIFSTEVSEQTLEMLNQFVALFFEHNHNFHD
jgi:hypothetical protein